MNRTVAELSADAIDIERQLMDATQVNALARSRLQKLLILGDAAKAKTCRAEIASSAARITELTAEAEELREAIKDADASEVENARLKSFEAIATACKAVRQATVEYDEVIVALSKAAQTLSGAKANADAVMQRAGVAPLRDHLTEAHVKNLVDMKTFVETDGQHGKAVTMDSLHQLRQSGRASLAKAGSDYLALSLRHAAIMLGVDQTEAA